MGVWDAELSLHAFERAVEKDPRVCRYGYVWPNGCSICAGWRTANDMCRQALKQDPESARAQLLQARLLFQRGACRRA